MIDLDHFILSENPDVSDYVIGTYLLKKELKNPAEVLKLAVMMATEQTAGTWVRVPGETGDLIDKSRGKVLNTWEIPDNEQTWRSTNEERTFIIQLGFPWLNFGPQVPLMLTTIFGNISMIGNIKLLDIQFSEKLSLRNFLDHDSESAASEKCWGF